MINNTTGKTLVPQVPPGSPTAFVYAAIDALVGMGPFPSALYVDPTRGNDTTAQRGNQNLPFATPQAAINAMQSGDTIVGAPVVIAPTATITIPAAVVRGGMVGAYEKGSLTSTSPSGTELRNTAIDLFDFGANPGLSKWTFANITLNTAQRCIHADGSTYARDTFLGGGLSLDNCFLSGTVASLDLKYAVVVTIEGGTLSGALLAVQCGTVQLLGGCNAVGAPATVNFDSADALAPSSGGLLAVRRASALAGSASFVTWSGQSRIVVDEQSEIGGLKAVALTVNGASVPSLVCAGYISNGNGAIVDLASAGSEIPDTATALTIDFRGTRFLTASTSISAPTIVGPSIIRAKVGGAAANFQTVRLDQTAVVTACTISAGAKVHLTAQRTLWPAPVYLTPDADGDILPDRLGGTIDTNGLAGAAKTWAQLSGAYAGLVRTTKAPDQVVVGSRVQLADACFAPNGQVGLLVTGNAVANVASWYAIFN